jgi:hypothetical protein
MRQSRRVLVLLITGLVASTVLVSSAVSAARAFLPTARAGPACTLYASPTGRSRASGSSPTRPTSLRGAHHRSVPGSVVCLRAGRYRLSSSFTVTRSGKKGKPIVYRSYGGRARLIRRASGSSRSVITVDSHTHHVAFHRLTMVGANVAASGVKCNEYAHHLVVRDSRIRNTGAAGVNTKRCDYVTLVHNMIHHTGYNPDAGWSSAISLNSDRWSDSRAGFHSFVVGNTISGASDESSYHSEGHGIIMDLGTDAPPVLIANNVVYENGANCIKVYHRQHVWVVNNTCYKNALDGRLPGSIELNASGDDTSGIHFINNIAYAWTDTPPYQLHNGASAVYAHNIEYGGTTSNLPNSVLADPNQLRRAKPRFRNPPYVHPTRRQQHKTALAPWNLGTALVPSSLSPAINTGIDPRTAAGLTAELRAGIKRYLARDRRGTPRPRGGRWDVGAYER